MRASTRSLPFVRVLPLLLLSMAAICTGAGCRSNPSSNPPSLPTDGESDDDETAAWEGALTTNPNDTVEDVALHSCVGGAVSTAGVLGLSKQLAQQLVECEAPGMYSRLDEIDPRIKPQPVVQQIPYVETETVVGLKAALNERADVDLPISSALRTVAQQYVLRYALDQAIACAPDAAGMPGSSNHHAGLAVDLPRGNVDDANAPHPNVDWRQALTKAGFTWYGSGDNVHYDYKKTEYSHTTPGTLGYKLTSLSVLAFQKLWNRNHPGDLLVEDGKFGTMDGETAKRLKKSPAGGFALGPQCFSQELLANVNDESARITVANGRAATVEVASSVPVKVVAIDETTGREVLTLDGVRVPSGVVTATIAGLNGKYLLKVASANVAVLTPAQSKVVCNAKLSDFAPRDGTVTCSIGPNANAVRVRVVERTATPGEASGAAVIGAPRGPIPFVPFTIADIKDPATGAPYAPGATVKIEENGEVLWQGSVEDLLTAMNAAEKSYADRGETLRGTEDVNLLELAHSDTFLNAQRADNLGLRSEMAKDKVKAPLQQCPKVTIDQLGLPPPKEPNMSPVDGDVFDPSSGPSLRSATPRSRARRSARSLFAAAPTSAASAASAVAASGVDVASQMVTLADGTRLEAGDLLDRINQQQDALCSVGYDFVSQAKLGTPDTLAQLLSARASILQDLGVSQFSKYFNLASLAQAKEYADVVSDIENAIRNKELPSAAKIAEWGQAAGLDLPDEWKVPDLPNIPSPVMPKRTDLKLLKHKTWDGLNVGSQKVASIYSNAWFEVRGQEKADVGVGHELDARGEGKAGAFLFNNEINLVYGSGRFTAKPTQLDGSLLFRVLGQDIIDKKLDQATAITKADRAWEYGDSLKYEETFMVGPIPVTVKAELVGLMYLGYEAGISLDEVYGKLIPGANATVRVQGGIGVAGLSAGAAGEMTVIDASVPVKGAAALQFDNDLPFLTLTVTGDLDYRYLDGRMAAYAEWPWFECSLRHGCRFKKKRADREIFAWAGERGTRRILSWGLELRPFGAKMSGDLVDRTDRDELAKLEEAASLEALRDETGRSEQLVFEKEKATFTAIQTDLASPQAAQVYTQTEALKKAAADLDTQTKELIRLASQATGG